MSMPRYKHANLAHLLASTPFIVICITIFSAACFSFMQTDDYCAFARVVNKFDGNPFSDTVYMYQNWAGRYSAMFFVALVGSLSAILPVNIVYSASLIFCLALFAAASISISKLSRADNLANLPLSLTIFAGTLLMMPSKLEQFIWLTGAAVYFIGGSLLLIFLQLLASQWRNGNSPRKNELLILLMTCTIVGFNEFLGIIVGISLAGAAYENIKHKVSKPGPHVVRLLTYLIAFATSILAPGNFARDSTSNAARHNAAEAFQLTIESTASFLSAISSQSIGTLLITVAAAVIAGVLTARHRPVSNKASVSISVLLLAAFPLHLWVYSFLTGEAAPGRVLNQAFMLASVGVCLLANIGGNRIAIKTDGEYKRPATFAAVLFGLAGLGLIVTKDYRTFARTLVEFGPSWHAQQLKRHNDFTALPEDVSSTAYVRPFERKDSNPPIFSGADIEGNPAYWVNRCVADYYQVPSVRLMRKVQN